MRLMIRNACSTLARTFDFVADAAPGVKEILAIGKVCWEVRERHYDLVIDSLSEIRLLAQSSSVYRRQVLAIKHYFARHGATVLLLVKTLRSV